MAFINDGKIILVEDKNVLLNKLGNNKLVFTLDKSFKKVPAVLNKFRTKLVKIKVVLNFF